jgi:hypothetical protein
MFQLLFGLILLTGEHLHTYTPLTLDPRKGNRAVNSLLEFLQWVGFGLVEYVSNTLYTYKQSSESTLCIKKNRIKIS